MYSDTQSISNESEFPICVWVEPNAFELEIPPGDIYTFRSTSEVDGQFEIEKTLDGFTIWAWWGADLLVKNKNSVIYETSLRSPIPYFVQKRKWWEFWK